MRTMVAMWLWVAVALWCAVPMAQAQEESKTSGQAEAAKPAPQESKAKGEQHDKVIRPFRLDFSVNELEDGKKINSRHYSINLTAGSADEIKIGSRVPVSTVESPSSAAQFQYIDLGTNIWALLREGSEELQLEVRSEISWTKHEDVDPSPRAPHSAFTPPIISQMKINGSTLLVIGKAMIIGSVDDPYSNRQFQLEVTATKLR
jgi:hypothetical protein